MKLDITKTALEHIAYIANIPSDLIEFIEIDTHCFNVHLENGGYACVDYRDIAL